MLYRTSALLSTCVATAAERVFDCGAADTTRTRDIPPPAARSILELARLAGDDERS